MVSTEKVKLSIFKKAIFAVLFLLVLLILLEIILQVAGVQSRHESPFFLLLRVHEYPEYFQRHPTLFWELVPNKLIKGDFIAKGEYHINSHGFRGPEFSDEKPPGTIRICCIGNSCTFGWEIPEGNTYPDLLKIDLEKKYPGQKFEVINCGVPGYTSHQGLIELKEKILNYHPDIITLSFGWNDIWGAGKGITDRQQKIQSRFVINMQNILARLKTYRLLKYALLEITEKKGLESFDLENPAYRVSKDEYRDNLSEIHRIAEENGIIPVYLTSPAPDAQVYFGAGAHTQLENLFTIHEEYNQIIRELRDTRQFWVVPIATYFQNQPDLFDSQLKDYIHYNQAGHLLVAETIANFMKRYRIVDNIIQQDSLGN